MADFRNQGRVDIVTNNFNDHPYFFRNQFPQKNWVAFRLQGSMTENDRGSLEAKKSNRDAVGALVRIYLGKEIMVRQVHSAGGYLAQSSRTFHFGLGDRPAIDRVEIYWPSGQRQSIDRPDINKLHKIVEAAR